MFPLLPQKLEAYCLSYSSAEEPFLKQLVSYTWKNHVNPRQLSGALQGHLLTMISTMIKPTCVLEIGTFSGYSAVCLSKGLKKGGMIHTIEADRETAYKTKRFFKGSAYEEKIQFYEGDALQVLNSLEIAPELSFIDGNKKLYREYLQLVWPKVPEGGWLIFDNTLWNGRVTEEKEREKDNDTANMHEFNQHVLNVKGAECMILPLRDGLTFIQKIKKL